jgi:hypothetical protein
VHTVETIQFGLDPRRKLTPNQVDLPPLQE